MFWRFQNEWFKFIVIANLNLEHEKWGWQYKTINHL